MWSPFALCWILVNVVPPFALWWMGSPLCTLVNGVSPLHFGEWGPPFALCWMVSPLCTLVNFREGWFPLCTLVDGAPPLDFGKFWWMESPLCTLMNGVPLCILVNVVPPYTLMNFCELGPSFVLWWTLVNWVAPFALWCMGSLLCTLVNGRRRPLFMDYMEVRKCCCWIKPETR